MKQIFTKCRILLCYTHAFCVVQVNVKPEVLEVQTELARSVH